MLNLTELEKAVGVGEQMGRCLDKKSFDVLLSFAKLALSLKEIPRDKVIEKVYESCDVYEQASNKGYNSRRLEDKAWLTARLMGLEDIISPFKTFNDPKVHGKIIRLTTDEVKEIAQAIRNHFTGEGR